MLMGHNKREQPARQEMHRRAFLGGAAFGVVPLVYGVAPGAARALQPAKDRSFPGMITRQKRPDNLEFPFPTLESFLTPNEQFFVRTHFEVPELEAKTWRLEV